MVPGAGQSEGSVLTLFVNTVTVSATDSTAVTNVTALVLLTLLPGSTCPEPAPHGCCQECKLGLRRSYNPRSQLACLPLDR